MKKLNSLKIISFKNIITFYLIVIINFSYYSQSVYIKLNKSIENYNSFFTKVKSDYNIDFIKQIKTSELVNSNVYKLSHQLDENCLNKLNSFFKTQKFIIYSSFIIGKTPLPPNDIPPTTRDFIVNQNYLSENPGVNALYAWGNDINGLGVTVRDIEYGLDFEHEEFIDREIKIADGMSISTNAAISLTNHGTSVAGVIFSGDGGYGTKGISYNAKEFILYPEWQNGQDWDRITAITNAVSDASKGDIIVYEMQIQDSNGNFVMAEYDKLVWDLTKAASNKGVIVIAAAGNGGQNLNSSTYSEFKSYGDSGAILVGASIDNVNHLTESFSNYGDRINVNAWGRNVFTTGLGDIQFGNDFHQSYTSNFIGTSSATAIVAGCATLLQSHYLKLTGNYMSTYEMRKLLVETGIPQANNDFPIGVFPDLKKAIEQIDSNILSLNKDKTISSLTFYPNPTRDYLIVKQLKIEKVELQFFDSLGKKILTKVVNKKMDQLDIKHLDKGIYFIKFMFKNNTYIKRIIKE